MSKSRKKVDPNQLSFDFDHKIEQYRQLKEDILQGPQSSATHCEFEEACIEIAAAIKRAIRQSGLSREQMVDAINDYFGWSKEDTKRGKHLSIHMFNHYLSKPSDYPIPTYYIYAIQRITGSLEPIRALAEAEGARVISGDEVRQMALGKLDEMILEMQRLKKELRGRR